LVAAKFRERLDRVYDVKNAITRAIQSRVDEYISREKAAIIAKVVKELMPKEKKEGA
jgi:hypothetical protein